MELLDTNVVSELRKADILRFWFEQVRNDLEDRVLSIDAEVIDTCAALHVPHPRPELGTPLAAPARVHGLTLVTRKPTDCQGTGVRRFNPWQARV